MWVPESSKRSTIILILYGQGDRGPNRLVTWKINRARIQTKASRASKITSLTMRLRSLLTSNYMVIWSEYFNIVDSYCKNGNYFSSLLYQLIF